MKCSFCGKEHTEVDVIVASPNASICDECISQSRLLVRDMKENSYKLRTDYESMYETIVDNTIHYLDENSQIKTLVVGISGGIDSALTAALARDICCTLDVKLIGSFIGIISSQEELDRANVVGETFCDEYITYDPRRLFEIYKSSILNIHQSIETKYITTDINERIRGGNIKARMRMICLFDLAHRTNGMVLSTDNYTEYLLGFWTLHGDVGNFGMLQYLWKSEVYGLSSYLQNMIPNIVPIEASALKACHDAHATDGLGITETDMDQIMPNWKDKYKTSEEAYNAVDKILYDVVYQGLDINHPVIDMMEKTQFKRFDPICIKRGQFF